MMGCGSGVELSSLLVGGVREGKGGDETVLYCGACELEGWDEVVVGYEGKGTCPLDASASI